MQEINGRRETRAELPKLQKIINEDETISNQDLRKQEVGISTEKVL